LLCAPVSYLGLSAGGYLVLGLSGELLELAGCVFGRELEGRETAYKSNSSNLFACLRIGMQGVLFTGFIHYR
jgi:hypothetical protein